MPRRYSSSSLMICIARTFGAPETVPAGELARRGGCGPLGALRDDDLEHVALADVLLRLLDTPEVLLARRLAHERATLADSARKFWLRPVQRARIAAQELGDPASMVEA